MLFEIVNNEIQRKVSILVGTEEGFLYSSLEKLSKRKQ